MKKIGKREIIILVVSIVIFLISLVWFCIKGIPEIVKPKVYYRTYTKEKGWSKWSKNGFTSGNEKEITAVQIKLKNNKNLRLKYNCLYGDEWQKTSYESNQVCGNKKDNIKSVRVKLVSDDEIDYNVEYRVNNKKRWTVWFDNYIPSYTWNNKNNLLPIKQIQIRLVEKK